VLATTVVKMAAIPEIMTREYEKIPTTKYFIIRHVVSAGPQAHPHGRNWHIDKVPTTEASGL
jgi:hypothetical protein